MFKRMKSVLPIMTIICCVGFTSVSVDAFEAQTQPKEVTQNMDYENSELRPLDYTIEEIREMTMAEFYSKCFPETWETFTSKEKEDYKHIKYSELQEPNGKAVIDSVFVSSAIAKSPSSRTVKGQLAINGDGGTKASRMDISYVLYDTTGKTYAGGSGGNSNCTYYGTTYESRVVPSGRRAYVEGIFRLKIKSSGPTKTMKHSSNTVTVK